jgi:hypothetical protein
MRAYMLAVAVAAAAGFAFPMTGSAAVPTDLSSQLRVETGPGGVGVRVGPRRRDRVCRTVTVRERTPSGNVRITKRRTCR